MGGILRFLIKNALPLVIDLVFKKTDAYFANKKKTNLDEVQIKRTDILLNICTDVAFADGVIDDSEFYFICQSFPFLKKDEIENKIARFLQSPTDYSDLPRCFFKKSDRISVWKLAYSTALINENYHEKEEILLNSLAAAFGLTETETIRLATEAKGALPQKMLGDDVLRQGTDTTLFEKSKKVCQDAFQNVSERMKSLRVKTKKGFLRE